MNQVEWETTDDVGRMLAFVTDEHSNPGAAYWPVGNRKLRLFACAVCRQAWYGVPCGRCRSGRTGTPTGRSWAPLEGRRGKRIQCPDCRGTGTAGGLTDPRSRHAVETVERHADGLATDGELAAACRFAGGVAGSSDDASWWAYVWAAGGHVGQAVGRVECVPAAVQAALLRDVCGNPFPPVAVSEAWLTSDVRALARAAYDERGGEVCGRCEGEGLIGLSAKAQAYDLSGRPCPDCGGTGRVVTTGHLDPVRLALLADALEEAGCTDAQLLAHLRGWETVPAVDGGVTKALVTVPLRGPHARGCWAVDAVLGLS